MNKGNYDLKVLYQTMNNLFADVTDNRFISERPSHTDAHMDSFIVISVPTKMFNNLGCGNTIARVTLYARDLKNTYPNIPKLDALYTSVIGCFPFSDSKFEFGTPTVIDGGGDDLGFHCWHLQFRVLIK